MSSDDLSVGDRSTQDKTWKPGEDDFPSDDDLTELYRSVGKLLNL